MAFGFSSATSLSVEIAPFAKDNVLKVLAEQNVRRVCLPETNYFVYMYGNRRCTRKIETSLST